MASLPAALRIHGPPPGTQLRFPLLKARSLVSCTGLGGAVVSTFAGFSAW